MSDETAADTSTVSVAMCTYNGEPHVETQVKSVLDQTRQPDELVVCDDGSDDRTREIVREVAGESEIDLNLVQNDENLGVTANFDQAIDLTTGDYIFLSDQDDRWYRSRVKTMLQELQKPDVGLVYCDANMTGPDLEEGDETIFEVLSRYDLHRERSVEEIVKPLAIRMHGCTMAFRAGLKPLILPIPPSAMHDYWVYFMANAVSRAKPVNEPLMDYRRHTDAKTGGHAPVGLNRWIGGLKNISPETYTERRRRWEEATARLKAVSKDDFSFEVDEDALRKHREASVGASDFAEFREDIIRRSRPARILPAIKRASAGDYHRYHLGIKGLAADLILSPQGD